MLEFLVTLLVFPIFRTFNWVGQVRSLLSSPSSLHSLPWHFPCVHDYRADLNSISARHPVTNVTEFSRAPLLCRTRTTSGGCPRGRSICSFHTGMLLDILKVWNMHAAHGYRVLQPRVEPSTLPGRFSPGKLTSLSGFRFRLLSTAALHCKWLCMCMEYHLLTARNVRRNLG